MVEKGWTRRRLLQMGQPLVVTLLETNDPDTGVELRVTWMEDNQLRFDFTAPNRSGSCSLGMDDFDDCDEFLITGQWNPERLLLEVLSKGEDMLPQRAVTQF